MKTSNLRTGSPFRKGLLYAIILLGSFTFSSYKSVACSVSINSPTIGLNGHVAFTTTSTGYGPGLQYSWNPGDGSGWHYGGSSYNYVYTTNNTFTVTVAANDSLCYDTASVVITVSNVTIPCTLAASYTMSYGPNGQVTFTSTSTGTNANTFYYWKPGDSNQRYQEPSTYTHTYPNNGYYYAWLVVEDTGSAYCADSVEELVHITNAPCNVTAGFTYVLDTNGQVTFTNTSTSSSPSNIYKWNFGDLNSYITWSYNPFVHTYSSDGTYTVTLIINGDSTICADTISIPITVTNACNMNASFTMQYDSNGQVMFTSTSTGVQPGAQYGWSFGDNTSLNGEDTATHQYPFIGYYTVTLTVVNPGGCTDTSTHTFYIQNRDSLSASFTYRADTLNTGTYYFTSNSKGTNSNTYYKWTPGDGDPSDSGLGMTTYTHTYSINGPYSATLTIWYTILPRVRAAYSNSRFDESSYTLVINVTGVTGIQSINDNAQYTIYPNPNNGLFHIAVNGLTQGKNAEIRISDMMGRMVYQSNATVKDGSTLSDVSLPNVSAGVYLLQVISNGTTYTSKIAIQK